MLYSEINKYISVNTDTRTNTKNISTFGNTAQTKFEDHVFMKIEQKKIIYVHTSPLSSALSRLFSSIW